MKKVFKVPPLKIKVGKGPLTKKGFFSAENDGKTPFAAGTMHRISKGQHPHLTNQTCEWMSPINFSLKNLITCLMDPATTGVDVILEDNTQFKITKEEI